MPTVKPQEHRKPLRPYAMLFGALLFWHAAGAGAMLALVGTMGTDMPFGSPYNLLLTGGSLLISQWLVLDAPLLFIAAGMYAGLMLALFARKPAIAVAAYLIPVSSLFFQLASFLVRIMDDYFRQSMTIEGISSLLLLPLLALACATYPLLKIWRMR